MRTFLLCIFLLSQNAFAFDSSDASLIKAYELLNNGPRGKENFNVDEENFDKEGLRFRNQKRELTNWKQIDEFEFTAKSAFVQLDKSACESSANELLQMLTFLSKWRGELNDVYGMIFSD